MESDQSPRGSRDLDPATQFPLLYDREYDAVFRTIRAIVLDQADAEDLAQETFVRAYRARLSYRPTAPPGAWLHRIAVNTAISHLRRRRLTRLLPLRLYQTPEEHDYSRSEARSIVEPMLHQLSPKLRAAVVLHYVHGYTREEISVILGIPSGTVASRLNKAMIVMRRKLAQSGRNREAPSSSPAQRASSPGAE